MGTIEGFTPTEKALFEDIVTELLLRGMTYEEARNYILDKFDEIVEWENNDECGG